MNTVFRNIDPNQPAAFAVPTDTVHCYEPQAPGVAHLGITVTTGKMPWTSGLAPEPRTLLPGYDSGVMCMLVVLFLFLTTNFRHYSTFIKTFAHDLFSVRTRANVFDERNTTREIRVQISLILMACFCEAILIYSALTFRSPHAGSPFKAIGSITCITLIYYLWQLIAYNVVGSVFAGRLRCSQWIKGFNASQCLLALPLLVPALLALFYPAVSFSMAEIGAGLYMIARLIFIFKGFRIFYTKSYTLVYFILYLCALEIVPVLFIYKASLFCL